MSPWIGFSVLMADTQVTPDEGGTTGSRSLETSGVAIRAAAASAREHLLSLAFEQLDSLTPAAELRVTMASSATNAAGAAPITGSCSAANVLICRAPGRKPEIARTSFRVSASQPRALIS